jgi:hypothetical protein
MSGRYTLSSAEKLAGMLRENEQQWLFEARYHVAPPPLVAVVLDTDPGRLISAKWSLGA